MKPLMDMFQFTHFAQVQHLEPRTPTLRHWANHGCAMCWDIVNTLDALCRYARRGATDGHANV